MVINFILFILGAAIGSFLNVLIDRLPNEESIMGRSHCDYCKKQLPAWVNVPILSWFFLGGKTVCCKKPLSIQYPLIEFLTAVVFVGVGLYLHITVIDFITVIKVISLLGILSTLIVIFFADAKYHIIPDSMQFLFLVFSVMYLVGEDLKPSPTYIQMVIDGLIVMAPILLLFAATLGRGMGFGDVKLAFTMGVLLGRCNGLLALYIAFIIGAVVGVIFIVVSKRKMKSTIAFGPFLVIGTAVMLFFSDFVLCL